jgi:uncharacterized membrane protein
LFRNFPAINFLLQHFINTKMQVSKPKIKIALTRGDRILERAGFFLLIVMWILALIIYFNSPAIIPIHFNGSGEANGFGDKVTLLFLPLIPTVIFLGLTKLNKYPHLFNYAVTITEENAAKQYINATRMIRVLKTSVVLVFTIDMLFTNPAILNISKELGSLFLPLTLGLLFVPLVFYVIKSFRGK